MIISKNNLAKLIESYLSEQEDDQDVENAEENNPETNEKEGEEGSEENKKESESVEEEIDFNKLGIIPIEIDGEKHEVEFFKDVDDSLKFKVDGNVVNNATPQDYATLAGLGLLVKNNKGIEGLEKIAKLDVTLKDKSLDMIKQIIKQRMATERPGFSAEDIRKALKT